MAKLLLSVVAVLVASYVDVFKTGCLCLYLNIRHHSATLL